MSEKAVAGKKENKLRSEVGTLEPGGDTNHPEASLDGAEGKSLKTRKSGGPRARESRFSLRASEALPAILGPSGAATRLPGPKNLFFLKLALFISELLLELPGAPGVSLELSWIPSSLQGCPRLPQARGNLSRLNARIPPPHNAPPGDP